MELATVFSLIVALSFCMCVTYGQRPYVVNIRVAIGRNPQDCKAWDNSGCLGPNTVEPTTADPTTEPTPTTAPTVQPTTTDPTTEPTPTTAPTVQPTTTNPTTEPTSEPPGTTEPVTTAEPNRCADEEGTCQCPWPVPAGFDEDFLCSGRCYRLRRDTLSYTAAAEYCASMTAHLATPRTQEESDCLARRLVGGKGMWIWLGYHGGNDSTPHIGADGKGAIPYEISGGQLTHKYSCVLMGVHLNGQWSDDLIDCGGLVFPMCQLENCALPTSCPDTL